MLDLLAPLTGRRPTVTGEEPLGGDWAPVTRVHLDGAVAGAGSSVVVKTTRHGAGDWGTIEHLHREGAALALLDGQGVAPELLATDDDLGLVVMSDVGGPTLESVLLGTDGVAAASAVVALGDCLGRLHAATTGREGDHLRRMAGAGSTRPAGERYGLWTGVDGWGAIEDAAHGLGFPSARPARDDVDEVRERLVKPGPFLALTHTDPSPVNALVTGAGVVLVDYEGSGFRHVGLDAAWLHFPFPNYSAHYGVVPDDVVRAAGASYRARLADAVPEARSDDRYDELVVDGLAAALVVRAQRLDVLAADGQAPRDSWRRRTQLVQQIEVFVDRCAATGRLPALARWFTALAEAMRERWADAGTPPAPLFPAFAARREPAPQGP